MPATISRRSRIWARVGALITLTTLVGAAYYYWSSRSPSGDDGSLPDGTRTAGETAAVRLRKPRRVLTMSLKNIVLWNPSPDPQNPNHAFRESALPFMHSLVSSGLYEVYLIAVVNSDLEERQIQRLLHSSGLYASGLDPRRVLFCSTEEGKGHIVRHIEPRIHVESNDTVIRKLSPHVDKIIRVKRSMRSRRTSILSMGGSSQSLLRGPIPMDGKVFSAPVAGRDSQTARSGAKGSALSRTPTFSSFDLKESLSDSDVTPPPDPEAYLQEEGAADLLTLGNVCFSEALTESGLLE
ncbi:hypothetical protein HDU85_002151 [Gaertneriomyces sp. JEL0708]|nr:hypothetical protein HDU85_002151 [Gaertneriomyces sp. JEL0708]